MRATPGWSCSRPPPRPPSHPLAQIHAVTPIEPICDYPLHGLKGVLGLIFENVDGVLTPTQRTTLQKNFDRLHHGEQTVFSGVHRRLQLASTPDLLGEFELGELHEAMDALAQAMVWGIRVTHARWHAQHHFCVLRTAVLMHKFAVLLTRCIPATKMTTRGEKQRTLYGLFFHQLTAHLVEDLKRVCPMHVMCEWMEMWWGPLRRLSVATSNKRADHLTLNMIVRMFMRDRFVDECGARASYAEPSHSDHGPINDAYLKHYGAHDGERLELDDRFLGPGLEALLRQVPEYLELGEGVWYSVISRGNAPVLVFHVGASDADHVLPARQHFRSHSAGDGRRLEEEAFERYSHTQGNLVQRFCTTADETNAAPTNLWADLLRTRDGARNGEEGQHGEEGQPGFEQETDDEEEEDEDEEARIEAEARELVDDDDEGAVVHVAPKGPAEPLPILDLATTAGSWSGVDDKPLDKKLSGVGLAHLRRGGETIGTYAGTIKSGTPHGHGRLEIGNGGWRGEMVMGNVAGSGEAWDEAGNRFRGSTVAPRWLLEAASAAERAARAARRSASAPFDERAEKRDVGKLRVLELRNALRALGKDEKGSSKGALAARLLDARRQAHLVTQRESADGEEGQVAPEGGYAGTMVRAGGPEESGLWEEGTLTLLHRAKMIITSTNACERAIESAETAASEASASAAAAAAVAEAAASATEVAAGAAAPVVMAKVEKQALRMLAIDLPNESVDDLRDRWKGQAHEGVFEGSVLVIALAFAAAGQLMGFAKGFAMAFESEAYLDELLVGADFRGMRLAPQLMLTFLDACDKQLGGRVQRVRLQCKRGEKMVGDRRVNLRERVYKPMGVDQEWEVPTDGEWAGVGPSDEAEYVMLHGTGEGVRRAAGELAAGKELPAGVSFHAHLGRRAAIEANATGSNVATAAAEAAAAAAVAAAAATAAAAAAAATAAAAPAAATPVEHAAGWTPAVGACKQRALLPPTSSHAAPGGLLEELEVLEAKARFTRLQGTTRMQLTQKRDRALLAVVDCHLASRRAEKEGVDAGEAGADLELKRDQFFAEQGVGVPAFAAKLSRAAADVTKSVDEYVAFLHANADLVGDLRKAARLTSCAPRAIARESEVRVTGSRGERLLGGTEGARRAVLGSELDQVVRKRKRQEADLAQTKAREADLRAQKEAMEALARQMFTVTGEATGSVVSGPSQQSGSKRGARLAAVAQRRIGA